MAEAQPVGAGARGEDDRHYALLIRVDAGQNQSGPPWAKKQRDFVGRDEAKLNTVLGKFNVEVHNRVVSTKIELDAVLNNAAAADYSSYASFMLVISAYGTQSPQSILLREGPMALSKIVDNYFLGRKCPSLQNKMKFFLIQACDHGTYKFKDDRPADMADSDGDGAEGGKEYPDVADNLLYWSSFPGAAPWRRNPTQDGSIVIDHFCQQMDLCPVGEILTLGHNFLAGVNQSVNQELETNRHYMETPNQKLPLTRGEDTFKLCLKKVHA